jgi:hypothetical protein
VSDAVLLLLMQSISCMIAWKKGTADTLGCQVLTTPCMALPVGTQTLHAGPAQPRCPVLLGIIMLAADYTLPHS